jgi:isopenicillin N synthase-like dioxygenase
LYLATMANSSETSWRDNADIKKEIEDNNQWSGDLKLPPRMTRVRFQRVPDFNDADFDWSNPEGMLVWILSYS